MKMKEAIDKLKYWFSYYHDVVEGIHGEGTIEAMKQVEKDLQRGEEYKRILEHIRIITIDRQIERIIDNTLLGG